jgi:hypothetical protein
MHRTIQAHMLSIAIKEEAEKLKLIPRWIKLMQGTKWKEQMLKLRQATEDATTWSGICLNDDSPDMQQLKDSIELAKRMIE